VLLLSSIVEWVRHKLLEIVVSVAFVGRYRPRLWTPPRGEVGRRGVEVRTLIWILDRNLSTNRIFSLRFLNKLKSKFQCIFFFQVFKTTDFNSLKIALSVSTFNHVLLNFYLLGRWLISLLVTSGKTGTKCPSFHSFYCSNVWKLWIVIFYVILILIKSKNINVCCFF